MEVEIQDLFKCDHEVEPVVTVFVWNTEQDLINKEWGVFYVTEWGANGPPSDVDGASGTLGFQMLAVPVEDYDEHVRALYAVQRGTPEELLGSPLPEVRAALGSWALALGSPGGDELLTRAVEVADSDFEIAGIAAAIGKLSFTPAERAELLAPLRLKLEQASTAELLYAAVAEDEGLGRDLVLEALNSTSAAHRAGGVFASSRVQRSPTTDEVLVKLADTETSPNVVADLVLGLIVLDEADAVDQLADRLVDTDPQLEELRLYSDARHVDDGRLSRILSKLRDERPTLRAAAYRAAGYVLQHQPDFRERAEAELMAQGLEASSAVRVPQIEALRHVTPSPERLALLDEAARAAEEFEPAAISAAVAVLYECSSEASAVAERLAGEASSEVVQGMVRDVLSQWAAEGGRKCD